MESKADTIERLRKRVESCANGAPGAVRAECSQAEILEGHGEAWVENAAVEGAMRKIERLCAVREQSTVLLERRLVREGYEESCVREAIDRAVACGLLDDLRYADMIVRSRRAAGKGAAGIVRELAACGIDVEEIPGWPEDYLDGEEEEVERALALLERKPPRSKNKRESAFRRLVAKGYSTSVATKASRKWCEMLDGSDR